MARYKKISKKLIIFICLISFIIGIPLGFIASYIKQIKEIKTDTLVSGDLQIHFLELGNEYNGDCILIKINDIDILIDGGSKTSSYSTIKNYLDRYVKDGILEYVIATHAHEDHIAIFSGTTSGNSSILNDYTINNIYQFSRTNSDTKTYNRYKDIVLSLENEGTKVCDANELYNNLNNCTRITKLENNINLQVLDQKFYYEDSHDENNYSLSFLINQGDNHFLFTGDLEKEGEESLIERNTLPKVKLYKASHHGSNTSSTKNLLDIIRPEIVVFTCVAGSLEYSHNFYNTFPTDGVIKRILTYTNKLYVTSMMNLKLEDGVYKNDYHSSLNGNIIITSNKNEVKVTGSNNDTILTESNWYKDYYKNLRTN